MEKKSISSHLISTLLLTGLCIDAAIFTQFISYPYLFLNWTGARHHCQSKHVDLITLNSVGDINVLQNLVIEEGKQFWIGLFRDFKTDAAWTWINLTGENNAGLRLSESGLRITVNAARRCTVLDNNLMWRTKACHKQYPFYCTSGNIIQYHETRLRWDNASNSCQSDGMNLATVTEHNTGRINSSGWIGLELRDESWKWSGGMTSHYRNWAAGEPFPENCVVFNEVRNLFQAKDCAMKFAPVCQDDNLVLVKENKTWEEALHHCRSIGSPCKGSSGACTYNYQYNLLSLLDSERHYVRDRIDRATTDEVWIGLRFLGGSWFWMDQRKVTNNDQLPSCPSQQRHCGTLSKYDANNWIIRDCAEKRNFVCYKF